MGAVGGNAVEALARAGVGHLKLVDFDTVSVTNLNRQILALNSTIGKKKVDLAVERVRDINPRCTIEPVDCFVDKDNMESILSPKPDILVDAFDSIGPKIEVIEYCVKNEIPIISSMGAALKRDPSKIKQGDLFETSGCSLARRLRKQLRRRGINKGVPCVYSTETPEFTFKSPEEEEYQEDLNVRGKRRMVLGSMPTITGIFGLTIANWVIEFLIKD